MSVSDANLIGVVKFYDGLCGRRSAKLDRRVNSLIRSAVNDTVLTSTATDRQITQRVMETDRQTDARTWDGRADLACPQSRVVPFLSSTTIDNFSESNLYHVCRAK